jgi:hypothetical protein
VAHEQAKRTLACAALPVNQPDLFVVDLAAFAAIEDLGGAPGDRIVLPHLLGGELFRAVETARASSGAQAQHDILAGAGDQLDALHHGREYGAIAETPIHGQQQNLSAGAGRVDEAAQLFCAVAQEDPSYEDAKVNCKIMTDQAQREARRNEERFNSGVRYKNQRMKWDTVIEEKTSELARFLTEKTSTVDFTEPTPNLERPDNRTIHERVNSLTWNEAKRLGVGKSTFHYLRQNAGSERPFRPYTKTVQKLQGYTHT